MAPEASNEPSTSLTPAAGSGEQGSLAQSDSQGARLRQAALEKMQSAASFLHGHAETPVVGKVADNVASGLDQTVSYVDRASLESVQGDVRGLVQRYPLRSLAVGLGLGVLIGRTFDRR